MHQIISKTLSTSAWLLKIMLPVSLLVSILDRLGVIEWMAGWLDPIFSHAGLPGEAALVFLTGALSSTYAAVAVLVSMDFTLRQATIVSIMVCLCHALPVESAVEKKTGSSFFTMVTVRVCAAIVCAFYLNAVLPELTGSITIHNTAEQTMLSAWIASVALGLVKLTMAVLIIIFVLMSIQQLLDKYHLIPYISRPMRPLMALFGLPANAAYMWIVGNVLGLSYGSAVMLDIEKQGLITQQEANEVNFHLSMNHSLLEDTLVFAALGIPPLWIISTRVLFAIIVVWGRKAIRYTFRQQTK